MRAGWNLGEGLRERLRRGEGEAVIVPWGLGANCGPVAWRHTALWMRPGGRTVLTATLRPRREWIGGVPTFDAYRIARPPYPTDRGWPYYIGADEKVRGRWLDIEEYWSMALSFPLAGRNGVDFRPFDRWAARNPELARLFPAAQFLGAARHHPERDPELRRAIHGR